jgi:hypothetical protein
MARGFESKDVEFQQAEAERRHSVRPAPPRDRAVDERRDTLRLSLARTRGDLALATSDRHRRMLEAAIEELERRLSVES